MNKFAKRLRAYMQKGSANDGEISFLDVKALYDAAFAEKDKARVNLKRYRDLMVAAQKMDTAYRAQLATAQKVRHGRAAA